MHQQYFIHQYKKKNLFHYDTEIDRIYLLLRFHCSELNSDKYKLHFLENPKSYKCNKNKQETIHHYFMDCPAYVNQRQKLKDNISKQHETLKTINNKQIIQLIEGITDPQIEDNIYRNIYQFIIYCNNG